MQKRKLEELNLLDDFLFGSMVTHPEVGEKFVRKLLKIIFGREFGSLKIIPQKVYYGKDTDKHGARLDVYLEEDIIGSVEVEDEPYPESEMYSGCGECLESEKRLRDEKEPDVRAKCSNIYDIEPDQKGGKSKIALLPKRVRFYHGIIDAQLLRSGTEYDGLKNVTIIMIVPFDPFGYDRMVYTITRSCKEVPGMPYDDGSCTLYLYTQGKEGNISEELRQLLNYMEITTRENAVNKELQEIQQMVEQVKTDEGVSIEYMKSFERDWQMRKEGREEERINTERERKRAEEAEGKIAEAEEKAAKAESKIAEAEEKAARAEGKIAEAEEKTAEAEARIKQLEEELERIKNSSML